MSRAARQSPLTRPSGTLSPPRGAREGEPRPLTPVTLSPCHLVSSPSEHHPMQGREGLRRRLEVTDPVALRDRERRPPVSVLSVPDFDPGALVGEELHDPREVLVGSAVHGRLAV